MLAALLLAGIVAAPLGSAGLFAGARPHAHVTGPWPAARRLVLALIGTAVLAAAAAVVLRLLHATEHNLIAGAAGVVAASLIWLPVTRRWRARAHLCWSSSVFLFAVYLVFALRWTFESHLGLASTAGGVLLWLFEVFAALLSCAYLWEICDALGTEQWRRRITRSSPLTAAEDDLPFVSLHVPAHNEPPDMVIETLRCLLRLDYPRYEVILIDDNTSDEALWRPVEAWCAEHGVKFAHLADWPGYKSGALNYALRELTDEAAEVIGVVDSDYQIEPGFLRGCAAAFTEPWVGFIQCPQDYRDWQSAPYYRRLYYSYKYFFAISQPSRNEHDGAIFAGTMGLIRRVALEQLGGWDEWCITEDAELSLRLLRAGWHGLHRRPGRGARRGRRGHVPAAGAHAPPGPATQPARPGAGRPHQFAGAVPEQLARPEQHPGHAHAEHLLGQHHPVRGAQPDRVGHAVGHRLGLGQHAHRDSHADPVTVACPVTVRRSSAG